MIDSAEDRSEEPRTRAPFAAQAAAPDPVAAQLLLAFASELRAVDAAGIDRELDRLAEPLRRFGGGIRSSTPVAEEDLLAVTEGFRAVGDDDPEALMLDAVVSRRAGHPILLAVALQEASRRAGFPLLILGRENTWVAGDVRFNPAVLVDPGRRTAWPPPFSPPELLPRRCSHEVALGVIARLSGAYARRGDLGRAARAAELALALPIGEPLRRKLELERDQVKACLN